MNDKELLELAAKAAGYSVSSDGEGGLTISVRGGVCRGWDPLTNDGDALRLAVKLGFIVDIDVEEHYTEVEFTSNYEDKSASEGHAFDAMAATRRAIVRAAAAIGEKLP